MVRNIGHDESGVHCGKNIDYTRAKINNNLVHIFPNSSTEDVDQVLKIIQHLRRYSIILKLRAIANKIKQFMRRLREFIFL